MVFNEFLPYQYLCPNTNFMAIFNIVNNDKYEPLWAIWPIMHIPFMIYLPNVEMTKIMKTHKINYALLIASDYSYMTIIAADDFIDMLKKYDDHERNLIIKHMLKRTNNIHYVWSNDILKYMIYCNGAIDWAGYILTIKNKRNIKYIYALFEESNLYNDSLRNTWIHACIYK